MLRRYVNKRMQPSVLKYVGYFRHGLDGLFIVLEFVSGSIGLNNNDYQ